MIEVKNLSKQFGSNHVLSGIDLTINKGDVMLYQDNCLVIFYKSFSSSYSYTKIGHIKDTSELEQALGEGSVKVGFSLKTVKVQSANNKFDFAKKTVTLNSGYEMPLLGLGTWTLDDATAENSVYTAIKDGYRLIDTAQYYGNEKGVGSGLKKAISEGIVKREDVFITTKVMPSNYDRAYKSIDESLEKLGVEYIDLMLIHQSGKGDEEVYKALCKGVKDGKLRSIGISNYYTPKEFDRVVSAGDIMPAVVQNENHPFYQNTELREYAARYGTVVESWYPFGGRGHTQDLFGDQTIKDIAKAHNLIIGSVNLKMIVIQHECEIIQLIMCCCHCSLPYKPFLAFSVSQDRINLISLLGKFSRHCEANRNRCTLSE